MGAGAAGAIVVAVASGLVLRPGGDLHLGPVGTTESTKGADATAGAYAHVPALVGLTRGQAEQAVELTGLAVVVSVERNSCQHAGVVLGQDPSGGALVLRGSTVRITVGMNSTLQVVCVSAADRTVAHAFEAFAADPSAGGPFASSVALGLGNEYRKTIEAPDQADPGQWRLDLTGYAERSGMLSVLDLVTSNADSRTITTDVSPSFCPTTLVDRPSPELTDDGRAIRIRIVEPPGACLQLATVDLYVNESNEIVGVNVGLGAP
jgi:hypothetical protein